MRIFVLKLPRTHDEIHVVGDKAIEGSARADGTVVHLDQAETREYFYAEFSRPAGSWQTWQNDEMGHDGKISGDRIGFVTRMPRPRERRSKSGSESRISARNRRTRISRETFQGGAFPRDGEKARAAWVKALGGIETVGGTDRQRTIFYTACIVRWDA